MTLNPDQFQYPMFVQAKDLMKQGHSGEWAYLRSEGEEDPEGAMWQMKMDKANESGLADSIREQGVHTPVILSNEDFNYHGNRIEPRGTILNGHHRAVVANSIDPNMEVPVGWVYPTDSAGKLHIGGDPAYERWERGEGVRDGDRPERR